VIERFNFYDIYGYLLPGFTLAILLWLPLGLTLKELPSADILSALIATIASYLIGHILQILSSKAIPSTISTRTTRRYPSDLVLDEEDLSLSKPLKRRIYEKLNRQFGLDVQNKEASSSELSRVRQDAFMLCRRSLLLTKAKSYAEQFEGMYTFMRGLTTATLFAFIYFLGWLLGSNIAREATSYAIVLGLLALAVSIILQIANTRRGTATQGISIFILCGLSFVSVGAFFGSKYELSQENNFLFVGICLLLLFLSILFYERSQRFTMIFAATVYRDFCVEEEEAVSLFLQKPKEGGEV
jgi:hypothetical protein